MHETQISLAEIKRFYAQNEDLFDVAVDAVVKGCVSKYYYDSKKRTFIGTVSSLEGTATYEVEVWHGTSLKTIL